MTPARPPSLSISAALAGLALAIAALAVGRPAAAQESPLVEIVDVELVLVDVLVTDRQGRPVLDLDRDDFTLLEEGEAVEISQFSPPAGGVAADPGASGRVATRSPAAEDVAPPPDRFVIFVDELHLKPGSRRSVLIQLAETLGSVPSSAELLLAVFDGAVRVEVPFTTDHKRIKKRLEEMIRLAPPMLVEGFAEERLLGLLPELLRIALENLQLIPLDQRLELACSGDLEPLVRLNAEQIRSRVLAAAGALDVFIGSLGGFDGRKVLLHVSDGLPLVPGQVVYEYAIELCDGSLAAKGMIRDSVPALLSLPPARTFPTTARLDMLSYSTQGVWARVNANANANRVTFYTLQASGLTAPRSSNIDGGRPSAITDSADRLNQQDSIYAMADETGGRATFNTNDFRLVVDEMVADSRQRYELAFQPAPSASGRPRELEVQVARDGVEVRHRKSYQPRSAERRAADRLATALLHDRTENPHDARLTVEASGKVVRRRAEVVVSLEVPLANVVLVPGEEKLHGQLSVLLVARDQDGNQTGVGAKNLVLAVDPGDRAEVYEYEVSMELPPGATYRVAAAVRDLLGAESSYLTASVEVPER